MALLLTSLTVLALVGLVAHWRLSQKFSEVVLQDSFAAFKADVTSYFATYGSWEKGQAAEPFSDFVRRRHEMLGSPASRGPGTALSGALRRLTAAIQAVGEGKLRQRVDTRSSDEVGMLAAAFNRMSDDLERSHKELKQSHEKIRRQAEELKELTIRDALTELHNRRHFDEQAVQMFANAVRYEHPLSIMIGDIDYFKKINDRFTHATGAIRKCGSKSAIYLFSRNRVMS